MRNFVFCLRFIQRGKKRLFPAALDCVLAAALYAASAAAVAIALGLGEEPLPVLSALLPPAGGVPPAVLFFAAASGAGGCLFARRVRLRAAALSADFALRLRREAFEKILSSGARRDMDSFEADLEEADILLPAALFLLRSVFLFFLAALLVCAAAAFPRGLPALGALGVLVPAGLLCRARAAEKRKSLSAFRERENLAERLAALARDIPSAKLAGSAGRPDGRGPGTDFLARAFRETAEKSCALRIRGEFFSARILLPAVCAAGLACALFLYLAGREPALSAGMGAFCLFFILAVFQNTGEMADLPRRLLLARAAGQRLEAFLGAAPLVRTRAEGGCSAYKLMGNIEISGLSVFRESRQKLCTVQEPGADGGPVLEAVSLTVPAGQKLAVVGFSPETPARLLRVLARLCDYDEGELRLDAKDIRAFDEEELRERLDFVPREAFLFEGTVEENIRCGLKTASDEEVRAAAAKLGRGDWLRGLPDDLATPVGPSKPAPVWAPLVLLARTLLKRPAVCLIEEGDPVRDALSEVRIQEALYSVMAGRTAVIAARRLSTLRQADRIIVFDKGRPAEEGAHEELLARGGLYARIYEKWFRHQSPEYAADGEARPTAASRAPEKKIGRQE
jgi:ABC-type multidrug transport system fused ATPase/permease subunit